MDGYNQPNEMQVICIFTYICGSFHKNTVILFPKFRLRTGDPLEHAKTVDTANSPRRVGSRTSLSPSSMFFSMSFLHQQQRSLKEFAVISQSMLPASYRIPPGQGMSATYTIEPQPRYVGRA